MSCGCGCQGAKVDAAPVTGARFKVADMTCGHCVATIRKAFEAAMPGTALEIDLASREVGVAAEAAAAARVIQDAGYEAVRIG